MSTNVDEVALLLYRSSPQTQAAQPYESLMDDRGALGAALLMDLALRDRIRVGPRRIDPPRFVERERLRKAGPGMGGVRSIGLAVLVALALGGATIARWHQGWELLFSGIAAVVALLLLPGLAILALLLRVRSLTRLRVVEVKPTGDRLLDAALADLARGPERTAAGWLDPEIGASTTRTLLQTTLVERLQARGLAKAVYHPTKTRPLLLGATIDRDAPTWMDARDRLRRLLVTGERAEIGTVALALALALHDLDREIPPERNARGLMQLFDPAERVIVTTRLRAVAAGLAPIVAEADRVRYVTCLSIYLGARAARRDAFTHG